MVRAHGHDGVLGQPAEHLDVERVDGLEKGHLHGLQVLAVWHCSLLSVLSRGIGAGVICRDKRLRLRRLQQALEIMVGGRLQS